MEKIAGKAKGFLRNWPTLPQYQQTRGTSKCCPPEQLKRAAGNVIARGKRAQGYGVFDFVCDVSLVPVTGLCVVVVSSCVLPPKRRGVSLSLCDVSQAVVAKPIHTTAAIASMVSALCIGEPATDWRERGELRRSEVVFALGRLDWPACLRMKRSFWAD